MSWGMGLFCGCTRVHPCGCASPHRTPESGVPALVYVAATKVVAIASSLGQFLAWDMAVDWVVDQFGNDDTAIATSGAFEPLTTGARAYYLSHDLANWERSARGQFSGPALASALATIERGRQVIKRPEATLLDVLAVAKQISTQFDALHQQPTHFGGHNAPADTHWWENAETASIPPDVQTALPTPPKGSVSPATHVAKARAAMPEASNAALWFGLSLAAGVGGLVLWQKRRNR